MAKVLVIGGGITGAATAAFASEKIALKNVQVTIWDKARGAGGRMSTSRSPKNPKCTADLGAQYISITSDYGTKHKSIYDELLKEGVMTPMTSHIEGSKSKYPGTDYCVTNGMSSMVKHFLKKSGATTKFQNHVDNIKITSEDMIEVSTQGGNKEMFNAAVLTMPIPQILQLPGMKEIIDSETSEKLSKVQYSSRYALALFFDTYEEKISLDTDPNIHHQTSAEYISDDPIFCYAAIDNVKRGFEDINHPTSVVFHTNVPWGIKNLEVPLPEIEKILLKHFKDRYPNWPEPKSVKCLRWRYSQIYKPYENCPGAVILNEKPLIIAGGDGFVEKSGLSCCLDSAQSIVAFLENNNF